MRNAAPKIEFGWDNIANAVAQEMNFNLASLVQSVGSKMGSPTVNVVNKLIDSIKKTPKRTLTLSESIYLRKLIKRAFGDRDWQCAEESNR